MINANGKHLNNSNKSSQSKNKLEEYDEDDEINFDVGLDDDEKKIEVSETTPEPSSVDVDPNPKSIYVKNLDITVTSQDLEEHFRVCGGVEKVTLLCDKYTGVPKGYAMIEFVSAEGKEQAKSMQNTTLKGRQIKIDDKRKHIPTYYDRNTTNFRLIGNGQRGGIGAIKGRAGVKKNFKPY